MKVKVSYGAKLIKIPMMSTKALGDTISIYQDAEEYIAQVVYDNWSDVSKETTSKYKEHFVEALIHATKDNPNLKYKEFDERFYKFPSYLRRKKIKKVSKVELFMFASAGMGASMGRTMGRAMASDMDATSSVNLDIEAKKAKDERLAMYQNNNGLSKSNASNIYGCKCGYSSQNQFKFCPECGQQSVSNVPKFCPECGAKNGLGSKFCQECGKRF